MECESYTISNTSHLLGSVPAVIADEKSRTARNGPYASMQTFPLTNGVDKGQGYQTAGTPTGAFGQQPTSYWLGIFSVSSYTQYFNVDTDIVVNRLMSSLNPVSGDFFSKIDANPDL
ncbi:hypothetical protein DEO72_LG6g3253 [Vigna unguiculata]|nr:hypothetical protein DEO72_LG6g3253 [Vigna unguiculata]